MNTSTNNNNVCDCKEYSIDLGDNGNEEGKSGC